LNLFFIITYLLLLVSFINIDKPNISISSKVTKNCGVSKEDVPILIATIETSKPLLDHRLSLGEISENIKNNMWNEVYVQFNGKIVY